MKPRADVKDKRKTIIASENEFKLIEKYCKKNKVSFSSFVIDYAMERVQHAKNLC
jgi:hypothetical protein